MRLEELNLLADDLTRRVMRPTDSFAPRAGRTSVVDASAFPLNRVRRWWQRLCDCHGAYAVYGANRPALSVAALEDHAGGVARETLVFLFPAIRRGHSQFLCHMLKTMILYTNVSVTS